jgi:hypothetical protein
MKLQPTPMGMELEVLTKMGPVAELASVYRIIGTQCDNVPGMHFQKPFSTALKCFGYGPHLPDSIRNKTDKMIDDIIW